MKQQTISPAFVEDALACLRRQGFAPEPVLQAAGLVAAEHEPVTAQEYGRLWLVIAKATDDEFFGLSTRPMRHGSFALLCHAVLHAGTLGKALRRALQFLRVVLEDPHGELVVTDGQAQIVLSGKAGPYPAFAYRTFWLILLGLACWLTGRRIPLQRVDIAYPSPDQRADYLQFFGVPVHFDQQQTRLIFNANWLDLPLIRSEQALKVFLRGTPGTLLVRYRHDAGWVAKIRAHLKAVPTANWPDFDRLARQLGITPATLRRRLRSEGQNFSSLKDEMRSALAQSLLRDSELNVAEIANELGFTEPSTFHRAFRKWTGASPGAFRRDFRKSGPMCRTLYD
ncbi:AraC family transcriptional regulator [Paraburkholderia sp. Cy-641]|uniref:AraC family transcriptional regulator n=1 Tax=Paraburkholderia sp. Cy-641 TaxID=2608337 RepID=UPI0014248F8F|nr:AraC family transcriptional regulator [Paraburkholderia sp. Cy-641]NIF80470.1 AraC family transcriptional regulator [Paraburkholderia sp. Cy-641]